MNSEQVLQKNTKENYVKNLNASNEAKRLEEKVKSYHNTIKSNGGKNNIGSNHSTNRIKETTSFKHGKNSNPNSQMTNQLASKGLTAAGVPKPLADAAVNSKLGQKVIENTKKKNPALNMLDRFMGGGKKETEEQASDSGGQSFKLTAKVIRWTLIAMGPTTMFVVFMCLILSSSYVFLNCIKLGQADSLSAEQVEEKIDKKNEEDYVDIDDEYLTFNTEIQDKKTLSFVNSKLDESNLQKTASSKYLKRKYNEADLTALEEFYPAVKDLSGQYNEYVVYDFFFKMYSIYTVYRDDYGIYLDLPLLMSTLSIQTDEMEDFFASNLSKADRKKNKRDRKEFEFCEVYDNYTTTTTKGEHDMEILAQHMVSQQVEESCVDSSGSVIKTNILKDGEIGTQTLVCSEGQTYKTSEVKLVKDDEKYREFLKEFIEKKYYLKDKVAISNVPIVFDCESHRYSNTGGNNQTSSGSTSSSTADNSFAKAIVDLANSEFANNQGYDSGIKYIRFNNRIPGEAWCAMFVSYLSANTVVDGKSLYPDIVPFKSINCKQFMNYFGTSDRPNIKLYFNGNCNSIASKNPSSTKYIPKPGDYILFDWQKQVYDLSSPGRPDHIGIVEKYENGIIYTIEGNASNTIKKLNYKIDDCRVVGFGSWYGG